MTNWTKPEAYSSYSEDTKYRARMTALVKEIDRKVMADEKRLELERSRAKNNG